MTEPTKTYGCAVYRNLPGHIKVKNFSASYQHNGDLYLHSAYLPTVKPNPGDHHQLGRFIQYNRTVYYITMNHRVYETNIEVGETVRSSSNIGYRIKDNSKAVPVTMRKLDEVEWVFL